ncbi:MAG: prolyl aminopeptidase [Alphaproteobacteria bacterium]
MQSAPSKIQENEWRYKLPEKPNQEGMLTVSEDPPHRMYWCEYGNPQGEPVVFLHGGPGGKSDPSFARYFDPQRYRIIMYDQRGGGRSTPHIAEDPEGALRDNTTAHLVEDIEKLRAARGIHSRMHVFGGSWGSTLAIAYAQAHPEHVQSLVLRGTFLGTKQGVDYQYQGNAASYHRDPYDGHLAGTYLAFPDEWKEFVEVIPVEKRGDMVKAYAEIFNMHPETRAEQDLQDRAVIAWSKWEGATSYLVPDENAVLRNEELHFAKALAQIENYYFMNGCFLGGSGEGNRDNQFLIRPDNIAKMNDIPTYIVHGRYDQVSPRYDSDILLDAMQKAGAKDVRLITTTAGHAMKDRENALALTDIMDTMPPHAGCRTEEEPAAP